MEPQDEEMDPVLETGFSFMDSRPEFAMSVRTLLNNTFDQRAPGMEIADAICQQGDVGTYITVDNGERPEDAIVGFISLLDLTVPSLATSYLTSYFLSKCPELQPYLSRKVGYLVSERVLNTPDELVPKLHGEFLKDVEWAHSQRDGGYGFEYLILCTRYCKLFSEVATQPKKKKKTKVQEEIVFLKPEEEDFLKLAEVHTSFQSESGDASAASSSSSQQYHFSDEQHTEKMLMLLPWAAYVQCVAAMQPAL